MFTFKGYQVSFLGLQRPERDVQYLLPPTAEVEISGATASPPLCLHGSCSDHTLHELNVQLQNGFVFLVRRKRQTATCANTAKPEALRRLLMEIKDFRDVTPCGLVGM